MSRSAWAEKNRLCSILPRSDWRSLVDDFVQLLIETKLFPVPGRLEIISDPGLALAGDRGSRRKRQPCRHGSHRLLSVRRRAGPGPHPAVRVGGAAGSDSRRLPVVRVDRAAGPDVLVQNEPRQGRFGARHARTDVADDEGDIVTVPLGRERPFAGVVGAATRNTMPNRISAAMSPMAAAPPRPQSKCRCSKSPVMASV